MTDLHDVSEFEDLKPVMRRVVQHILDNFAEEINLDDLAEAAGISKFNLCRKFQKRYGISPMRWLWIFRATIAAEFITLAPSWSLTDVAFNCGFGSSAHFSRTFTAVHGKSPSAFRRDVCMNSERKVKRGISDFTKIYQDNAQAAISALQMMLKALTLQPG